MNKVLPLTVVVLLSALLIWMLSARDREPKQAPAHEVLGLAERPRGGDFTLESAAGPVSLSDFRGKVVLIYFGYTWCPDICPLNLGYLMLALDRLDADERGQVQVLFISVDPERDTPERLSQYTAFFAPEVLGLTGPGDRLARIAARYGAAYRRVEGGDSAMGYLVDHSAYTYVVDKAGRLRETLDHATPPDRTVEAIRRLLEEGKPR